MPTRSRTKVWIILLVILAVVGLTVSFFLDEPFARLVHEHPDARLRTAGRFISRYGDWPEHALLGVILWSIAYVRRSPRWQRIVLTMIGASVFAGLTANAVRIATGRPRPSAHLTDGWYGPHFDYKHNAFPSGHTAASTAFFSVLLLVEWRLGIIALIIPFSVGLARIYVDAHHFSDIAASGIIGIASAYIAARIFAGVATQHSSMCNTWRPVQGK
jgi:membrane-associated phospholipid phosphatase